MAYRTMDRPTFGGSLRLGASFPNHVSSLPAPSLSKRKLFAIFSPYGPIYFVARAPNLLNVLASGRKETHASPIYFWWRRFGEPPRNSSRDAALADCWRLRSTVVAEAGVSSQLGPSEPNLQKKQMEGNKRREKEGNGADLKVL